LAHQIRYLSLTLRFALRLALFAGVAVCAQLAGPAWAGVIHYVKGDVTGTNNGHSWANAYTDLQAGLAAAEWGDEIWVARGTYKPTTGTLRTVSFALEAGTGLYGGFAGAETERGQRNWETNATTLSGNIGTVGSASYNSYHVVIGAHLSVLDGFTITGGNANNNIGWGYFYSGGGMSNSSSSPTVTNCTFSGNTAGNFGGGMYNGRAMYYDSGSSPTVANCIFWDDTAPSGAEIYNNIGTPTFSHCDIKGSGGSGPLWNPALGVDGGGNIMANPRFVASATPAGPDGLWRTGDDGLRLQSDSPCIGAADPAVAPETDILGLPRGSAPDIGAYEFSTGGGSYTLTYNAGSGGSITGTTPQTVASGANGSEVTAVPNTGYRFVRWSDGVMTASRTDTNVTADITVTAMFAHSNPATAKDWALYE